jgi:endoglucanase
VLLIGQVDLTGGYYDAGDNVKYGLPLAFTVTTLAWTALSFEHELKAAGELKNVHSAIKWGTDYLLKCAAKKNRLWVQVSRPRTFGSLCQEGKRKRQHAREFWVSLCSSCSDLKLCSLCSVDQVGDPNLDHQCWVRPENMKSPRTLYEINEKTPGTEIAAETAASSMVFRSHDKKYSRSLINKAKMVTLRSSL